MRKAKQATDTMWMVGETRERRVGDDDEARLLRSEFTVCVCVCVCVCVLQVLWLPDSVSNFVSISCLFQHVILNIWKVTHPLTT